MFCDTDVPEVFITPAELSLRPGDEMMLECTARSTMPVTYEWSKVDGVISPFTVVDGSFLEIAAVTASDSGTYRCRAVTRTSHSEAFAEIRISGT